MPVIALQWSEVGTMWKLSQCPHTCGLGLEVPVGSAEEASAFIIVSKGHSSGSCSPVMTRQLKDPCLSFEKELRLCELLRTRELLATHKRRSEFWNP